MRTLGNKACHQLLALGVIQVHHLDPLRTEQLLGTNKVVVLTNDDSLDTVQDTSSGAHVARRQSGVHGALLVDAALQTAGFFQSVDLTMQSGRVLLESQVVATTQNGAILVDKGTSDGDSSSVVT